MLLATVNPEAAAAIGNIKKVGVGNRVVYHARAGMMRQGRTEFPADVLKQHPDDGSLDLYVIMEPEEIIMEQRVQFQSHNQPHHCWSVVKDQPGAAPLMVPPEGIDEADSDALAQPGAVTYLPSAGSIAEIHEHIAHLTERIGALEAKRGPGRPPNPPKPATEAGS